jgi:flagellar biosynthesis regulator FlaF
LRLFLAVGGIPNAEILDCRLALLESASALIDTSAVVSPAMAFPTIVWIRFLTDHATQEESNHVVI